MKFNCTHDIALKEWVEIDVDDGHTRLKSSTDRDRDCQRVQVSYIRPHIKPFFQVN